MREVVDPATGELRRRCNVVPEILVDFLSTMDQWDVAFLVSGDGDLAAAANHARNHGKRVYVASFRAQLGRELAFAVDKPILVLDDLRDELARPDAEEPAPAAASDPA